MRTGHSVFIAPEASVDIIGIYEYILATEGFDLAETCVGKLEEAIFSLKNLAERGKYPQELLSEGITVFRELQCQPWRIFYRILEKEVWVLAVLDGRRNISRLLPQRLIAR